MKIKLEQLHVFLTVANLGSFTAASEALGISKVAVSKSIQQLEKTLNCLLFQRTTRKLELTEPAHLLFKHASQVQDASVELQNAFSQYQIQPQGPIRLMTTPFFAEQLLIPHLEQLMAAYPLLQPELLIEERFPHLEKENIDIFIGSNLPGYDELVRKVFFNTRYVMCASKAYLQKSPAISQPEHLTNHRYITHMMRRPSNIVQFDNGQNITVTPYLQVNSTRAMLQCAMSHLGIIKVHEYVSQSAIAGKKLIEILPEYHKREFPVYMFYTYQKYIPQKIRVVMDFFESTYSRMAAATLEI